MIDTQEAEKLLIKLYAKRDDGEELDEFERGIFETLCWLIDGTDQPEIE